MRSCPDEVHEAVAELLRIALRRIRDAAGAGDTALCFIETDHVHNLPQLLRNYSPDLLTFYLTVERQAFLEQLRRHACRDEDDVRDVREMHSLWNILEREARVPAAHA